MVSEKIFSCYSHYKPLADKDSPWVWPIWTPGAWLAGFINVITKHCCTQNIKALGLMVSEKIFPFSSIVSLWELMTPWLRPIWTPGAWLAGFIKGITKHGYTQNIKALGLVVSEMFYVFPFITLWELSVTMETKALIQSGLKPKTTFPPAQ